MASIDVFLEAQTLLGSRLNTDYYDKGTILSKIITGSYSSGSVHMIVEHE